MKNFGISSFNATLFSNKKELTDRCKKMDGSQKHARLTKLDTKNTCGMIPFI